MNCLNFVKVGKVKVPKGSETFLMVSKKKNAFYWQIMHQKTHFHKFRDNLRSSGLIIFSFADCCSFLAFPNFSFFV